MKILVLRSGALGDFVLTLPALMDLRRCRPDADVELCTRTRHAFLARDAGLADHTTDIDAAFIAAAFAAHHRLPRDLRNYFAEFDMAISYLNDHDGILAHNLHEAGVKDFIAMPTRPPAGKHASDAWRRQLPMAAGGAPAPRAAPCLLKLPDKTLAPGNQRLQAICAGKPAVVMHPGSGSPQKNWPLPRFLELAQHLHHDCGLAPVFLLGEAESQWPPDAMTPWPVISQIELPEVAGILAACATYIGNDSGVTHLAAILGKPVMALFGPTDPASWAPQGARVSVIRAPAPRYAMPEITLRNVMHRFDRDFASDFYQIRSS